MSNLKLNNMEERNITVTLNKAKEWFNSKNATLKEIALQAFNKDELTYNFKSITTFKKACEVLNINYNATSLITENTFSKASAAMFKLNIIRKALNLGQDLHLTKEPKPYIYYPENPFVTESSIYYMKGLNSGKMEIIGKIKNEGTFYNVLGGSTISSGYSLGLGSYFPLDGVGSAYTNIGFLGCASKEIAQHFGKYFGMLITEAKYADMVDFEIVYDKYHNY